MGRIKTQQVKSITNTIFKKYSERFTKDFDQNKKVLNELAIIQSKKIRNTIAGYLTRLAQEQA